MQVGDRIFFYGSLRPPFDTQRRIGIASLVRHLGSARVRGTLHDLGAYPALTEGPGVVVGDLYEVADDRLADVLDPFEGLDPEDPAASLYLREELDLVTPAGTAWVYRHHRPLDPETMVSSGDWVTHLRNAGRDGTLGPDGGPDPAD